MKYVTIGELYDLKETIARELFEGKTYPWELLPLIKEFILKLGASLPSEEYDHPEEQIWIARDAKIAPTASHRPRWVIWSMTWYMPPSVRC